MLKMSHDVQNAARGRPGGEFGLSFHNSKLRNLTQFPNGRPIHPQSTKNDLFRKSNPLDTITMQNAQASLEQIRERIYASTSENPLASEAELTTEGELASIQS